MLASGWMPEANINNCELIPPNIFFKIRISLMSANSSVTLKKYTLSYSESIANLWQEQLFISGCAAREPLHMQLHICD